MRLLLQLYPLLTRESSGPRLFFHDEDAEPFPSEPSFYVLQKIIGERFMGIRVHMLVVTLLNERTRDLIALIRLSNSYSPGAGRRHPLFRRTRKLCPLV